MPDENAAIISHISLGTNDFERATAFYDSVLATIGCKRLFEFPGAVAYGKRFPQLWIQSPLDGKPAAPANGSHVGFIAASKEDVQAFYAAAIAAGARDDGAPGPRADYGEDYYGCVVFAPDGHKIEAATAAG